MSVTMQQILNDAKQLVNNLRERASTADSLCPPAKKLYNHVTSMREYTEEMQDQMRADEMRTLSLLVYNVQQENKHVRELQQENRELKMILEEHQSVLELIMSKYRQQITNLVCPNSPGNMMDCSSVSKELQEKTDAICDMAAVMKQAIEEDEANCAKEQEKLIQLLTENKGLRELLGISQSSGSLLCPLRSEETADKEVQTDA